MKSFKKLAAVLMLVSFIFAAVSPAMAASGIAKGSKFTEIGDERTFAGYKWTLYKNDGTYGYIITSNVMEEAKSDGPGSVTYQAFREDWRATDANKYSASDIRKVVSTNADSYEAQMQSYTGPDMAWAEANGTAAGKNYIVKHDMTKTGTDPLDPATYESPYGGCGMTGAEDDLLYVLSTAEAQALAGGTDKEKAILETSHYWWLRSPGISGVTAAAVDYDGVVAAGGANVYLEDCVRPALQINLESSIFENSLFKTDATAGKGKNLVTVGGGFMLPEVTAPTTLTKQTKETLTFTDGTQAFASRMTTDEITESIDSRIADGAIDLTRPLVTGKQLEVMYKNFAATDGADISADRVAAIVEDITTGSATEGQYVNYAYLSSNMAGSDDYFIVDTSRLADGTYNLYLFAEKINGTHEDPADTTTPVADAATALQSAGPFTLGDRTYTNEGTLAASHKAKALTANLGGGFNLSFENDTYNTGVTVGAGDNGKITADETKGTTLVGNISVETGATLTTENEFKFGGGVEINGTLFDKDSIEISGTLSTGDGAVLKGEDKTTSSLTTQKLNGAGALTAEALTLTIGAGKDNTIDGELALNDARLEGDGKDAATETAQSLVSTGNAELKDVTVHATEGGEIAKDLALENARLEGTDKNETTVTSKTLTENGESEFKNITVSVTDTANINGKLSLDEADLNGGVITVNGELNTKGGSKISGNVAVTGDYNVNGTTYISGTLTPKGNVNFGIDGEEKGAGYVFLNVDNPVDLKDATVNLIQTKEGYKLEKDETMTLITKAKNYMGEAEVEERGINGEENYKYIYSVGLESGEGSALLLGYLAKGAADQTKSFSEARLAGSAAINSASDLVAGQAIDNASSSGSWEAFAAIGGSHNRYETGSHVDLNSLNVAAGLSKKVKDNVTLGLFVEGGNGRYTTENEFEDGNVRADGDVNYFGGGIFAKVEGKKTAKGQLHGEASFRAGHMNSDYNSETFEEDEQTRFDTSNAYMGAHLGLGYKWSLKDNSNIDTYVKYLWNRQNSDSIMLDDETFDLDAINSHRLRAGFRYNGKENDKGIKFFGGLAYEYEFDGTAKGHMGEYALLEPDFKGGSGIAEIGFKYHKANSPWKVELGLTGYTGKRDSIGANLSAWYEFGK